MNVGMQKLLKKEMTRKEFLGLGAFAVASVFGIVGIWRQLASHAATPTASSESEAGTVTAPATKVSDTTASGGQAVKFGSATSSSTTNGYPATPGHAFFGIYVSGNDFNTVEAMESEAGAKFGISKAYYTFSSGSIPTAQQRQHSVDGRRIHIAIALRATGSYNTTLLPAPGDATSQVWKYTQITNGSCDAYLTWLANQLKSLPNKFTLDFNVEPENQSTTFRKGCFSDPAWYDNRNSNTLAYTRGVLREFADAYRHIHNHLTAAGVTDALWTMTWASLGTVGSWHDTNVYPSLYPGDDVIDVVAWDPYVTNPATQSPQQKWSIGYNYINNGGLDVAYFYPGTAAKNKAYMLSEYGTVAIGQETVAINWLNQIPAALTALPKIKAIQYWSSATDVDTRIHNLPAVRAAFNTLSRNPIFEHPIN